MGREPPRRKYPHIITDEVRQAIGIKFYQNSDEHYPDMRTLILEYIDEYSPQRLRETIRFCDEIINSKNNPKKVAEMWKEAWGDWLPPENIFLDIVFFMKQSMEQELRKRR